MNAIDYPLVYRCNLPPGLKGQRCRILSYGGKRFSPNGGLMLNSGDNRCSIEMESGEVVVAVRSAVLLAGSRGAREAVAKVARGGIRTRGANRRAAREGRAG